MPVCATFKAAVVADVKPMVVWFPIVSLKGDDPTLESFRPVPRKDRSAEHCSAREVSF